MKHLPDIENETGKSSISVCGIGVKQIEIKTESINANTAIGRLQMGHQKKLPRCVLLNLLKPNAIKTDAEKKFMALMAVINVIAATRLNECFCQLTTCIMMVLKKEDQVNTMVEGQPFTLGFARTTFPQATKCYV
jgi:uncharacterized membrane protein